MAVELNLLNSNSLNNIGVNFERVRTALQDVIGRDGVLPNHMNADLDLNSNDLLNVNIADIEELYVNGNRIGDVGWIVGNGAPYPSIGLPGQIYLDRLSGNVYGPKTSVWGLPIINIMGPKGEKGDLTEDALVILNEMEQLLLDAEQLATPGDNTVSTSKIVDGAVSIDKTDGTFATITARDVPELLSGVINGKEISYADGPDKLVVVPGQILQTAKEGFDFEVLQSGASAVWRVMSGPVALKPLPVNEAVTPLMWGVSAGNTATQNQPLFQACLDYIVAFGCTQVTPAGTYDFASRLFYPQGTRTFWDNVIMRKQFDDAEGIRFGSGPIPAFIDGYLTVEKGIGGSGPIPISGDFPTQAGTVPTDIGVVFAGRIVQTGEVRGSRTHAAGVVLEASANGNNSLFSMIRGLRTGGYGVECRNSGTPRDDNAVWNINTGSYGCWDSGFHVPNDYVVRSWTGLIYTEACCRKATGVECYIGNLNNSNLYIYAENVQPNVQELELGPNTQWSTIFEARQNKITISSLNPKTLNLISGKLTGNTPSEAGVRGITVTRNIPTRYISKTWFGLLPDILMERRIFGDKMSLYFTDPVDEVLKERFSFRTDGNMSIWGAGKGIRLTSPNGSTVRFLTIDNAGNIVLSSSTP